MPLKTLVKIKTSTATRVAIVVGIMVLFFAAGYGFVKFRPQILGEKTVSIVTPEAVAPAAQLEGEVVTGDAFVRGDANADGKLTTDDAVYTVLYLMGKGPAPSCKDAADVNDDGMLDLVDPALLLNFFMKKQIGYPPPSSPYPSCGLDPTADKWPFSQCVYLPCRPQKVGGSVPSTVVGVKQERLVIKPKTEPAVCEKEQIVFKGDPFIRGDVNADGKIDDLDVVYILEYLDKGPAPTCMDAADVNDDGKIDGVDSVYLLTHIYMNGPQPPSPFNACGKDSAKMDPWPADKCVYSPCSCK